MGNYKNRLQFVHHERIIFYKRRCNELCERSVNQIDRPALYAEPMVLNMVMKQENQILY